MSTVAGGEADSRSVAFPPDPRGSGGFTAIGDLRAFADAATVARSDRQWGQLFASVAPSLLDVCPEERFELVAASEVRSTERHAAAILLADLPLRTAFVTPPSLEWRVAGVELTPAGAVVTRALWAEGHPAGPSAEVSERWVLEDGAWWLAPEDLEARCQISGAERAGEEDEAGSSFRRPIAEDSPVLIQTAAGPAILTLVGTQRGGRLPMTGAPVPEGFEYVFAEIETRAADGGAVHVPARFSAASFDGLLYAESGRWEVRGCQGGDLLNPSCQRLLGIVLVAKDDPAPRLVWSNAPAQEEFGGDVWWWLPSSGDVATLTSEGAASALAEAGVAPGAWPETDLRRRTPGADGLIATGLGRSRIPAIVSPRYGSVAEADRWLSPNEPVQVVERNGHARAYPLRILIWHEIVNDVLGGDPLLVTYCPACNTALAFERAVGVRQVVFRTTGARRFSNIVMYDDWTESWWQQATGDAIVGELAGASLNAVPSLIIAWSDFHASFPDGDVLSLDSGFDRDYGFNPYLDYDLSGEIGFFDGEPDPRLPVMARVLGVESEGEAVAFRFADLASVLAVNTRIGRAPVAVFYERGTASALQAFRVDLGRDVGAAVAFDPVVDGQQLTFAAAGDGRWQDDQTGSTWTLLGEAIDGALEGARMERLVQDNGFWFSWAAFHPHTRIYGAEHAG